jgi:hypothetical protein
MGRGAAMALLRANTFWATGAGVGATNSTFSGLPSAIAPLHSYNQYNITRERKGGRTRVWKLPYRHPLVVQTPTSQRAVRSHRYCPH